MPPSLYSGRRLPLGDDLPDRQPVPLHGEAHIHPGKGHAIDPPGVVLVGGTGVLRQHAQQSPALFRRHSLQQRRRAVHRQRPAGHGVGKAAGGLRVGVGVGDVGLDVVDGRAVHQVRPGHMEEGAVPAAKLHPHQAHGGQADGVGAEGGAGGKHPQPPVAAQAGRAHGGGPAVPDRPAELPEQPDMGEALQPADGLAAAELRLKDHGGAQGVHQPALARDAEFGGKVAVEPGNDVYSVVHSSPPCLER